MLCYGYPTDQQKNREKPKRIPAESAVFENSYKRLDESKLREYFSFDDSFENTPAFAWLQENCVRFGFIMRYAADTFDITHINYEPWHYRYVGANHAEAIEEKDITLEEYIALHQMG